jgi:hypothetical protein
MSVPAFIPLRWLIFSSVSLSLDAGNIFENIHVMWFTEQFSESHAAFGTISRAIGGILNARAIRLKRVPVRMN